MLGKPKYNYGDEVTFDVTYEGVKYALKGKVEIIDRFGTFEQNDEPSYDIMVEEGNVPFMKGACLFKHYRESLLR